VRRLRVLDAGENHINQLDRRQCPTGDQPSEFGCRGEGEIGHRLWS
jgi:hypothetical protein